MNNTNFRAKIRLGGKHESPASHCGYRGRVIKSGQSIITTNPEEYLYYTNQYGFSCRILQGSLGEPKKEKDPVKNNFVNTEQEEIEQEEDNNEVTGLYEKSDLLKLSKQELVNLIKEDNDLSLTPRDIPKQTSKREIVDLILEAQNEEEDE